MSEMTFAEFCDYVKENIEERLGEFTIVRGPDIKVVDKNNGVKCTGLLMADSVTDNIAPNIYLEYYYSRYKDGVSMDSVLNEIADEFRSVRANMIENLDALKSELWQHDLAYIFPKLVNYERNKEMLEDVPYVPFQDLAVTFRMLVNKDESGVSSTIVKQDKLEEFGKSVDEMYEIALENYNRMFPAKVMRLEDLLARAMGMPGMGGEFETQAYVVTNDICVNGATSILDKKTLEALHEEMGGDFYILPSSLHECIAVPVGMGEESLLPELVREVNRDVLAETDFLSDTVYRYDGETRELSMINPPEWMREKDSPEMEEPGIDGPEMAGPEMGSPEPEQSLSNRKMSM